MNMEYIDNMPIFERTFYWETLNEEVERQQKELDKAKSSQTTAQTKSTASRYRAKR